MKEVFLLALILSLINFVIGGGQSNLLENWKFLSQPKIIKCKNSIDLHQLKNAFAILKNESLVFDPLVNSYECKENETSTHYSFKGEIRNYKFEGPGKFKILSK